MIFNSKSPFVDELAFLDRQFDDFAADFRADVNLHDRLDFSIGHDRFGDAVARDFFRLDGDGRF